jgi:hypothetical protein
MASDFKIGTTSGGITSLDALTTPCPDPQWEFHEYKKNVRLGDGSMRGLGPQSAMWNFPMIEDEQIAQLETFKSDDPIFIRSRKRDGTLAVFEVYMNWLDPRQDGDHMPGFQGYRSGLVIEFIVLSEVV